MKKILSVFVLVLIAFPYFSFAVTDYNVSPLSKIYKSDDACWRGVVHIVAVSPSIAHDGAFKKLQELYSREAAAIPKDDTEPKVIERMDVNQSLNLYHYWMSGVQPKPGASVDCTASLPVNDNSEYVNGENVTNPATPDSSSDPSVSAGDSLNYKPGPSGLVSDCNRGALKSDGTFENPCTFNNITDTVNKVINFLLFVIATPMAAIGLCYAGFLYLTSGGSSENVGTAKSIMKNLIMGYIVALIAWVLIKTIMVSLGVGTAAKLFLNITK